MTDKQANLYRLTVRRLARVGVVDPTAQIVALAEEIEHYRSKIHQMENIGDGRPAKLIIIDELHGERAQTERQTGWWAHRIEIRHRRAPISAILKCSVCDDVVESIDDVKYKYCPNCGAKMEG